MKIKGEWIFSLKALIYFQCLEKVIYEKNSLIIAQKSEELFVPKTRGIEKSFNDPWK